MRKKSKCKSIPHSYCKYYLVKCFIFLDKKHVNSAFACKTLTQCGMNLLLVIRLAIVDDKEGIENSLITVLHEGEARYMRRLRNSIPIYKKIE